MSATIIIPARLESQRLDRKPLIDIEGKPLVVRTVEAARMADGIDEVYVATDSAEVVNALDGATPVFCTTKDFTNGTARIADMLGVFRDQIDSDVIINLQVDEPLVDPVALSELAITVCKAKSLVTLVGPLDSHGRHTTSIVKARVTYDAKSGDTFCSGFSRDTAPFYSHQHVGVYGYWRELIMYSLPLHPSQSAVEESLEQLTWLDEGCKIHAVEVATSPLAVNTVADVNLLREAVKDHA